MFPKLAAALAGPGLALAVGWALLAGLGALRDRTRTARAAYAFLAGQTLLGATLWALSLAGWIRLDRAGIASVAAGLVLLGGCGAAWRLRRATSASAPPGGRTTRANRASPGRPARSRLTTLAVVVAGLQAGALLTQAATDPITDWDGRMTWSTAARFVLDSASATPPALTDPEIFVSHPRYPLLLPLGQATAMALVPAPLRLFAARPLYALYFLALLVVVHDATRRTAGARLAAALLLLTATLPTLATQLDGGAAGAYSDLPLGCLLGAGVTLAVSRRRTPGEEWLASLLLAGAALAKNEGLLLAPLALMALLAFPPRRDRQPATARFAAALRLTVPLVAAVALLLTWRARIPNRFDERYFERFSPAGLLARLPGNLAGPAERALEMLGRFADWGLFWWIAAGAAVLGWRAFRRREARVPAALLAGTLAVAAAAYATHPDLALVEVTWNRLLLQAIVPILALLALALRGCRARLRRWGSIARFRELRSRVGAATPLAAPASPWASHALATLLLAALAALALPAALRGFRVAVAPEPGDPFLTLYFLRWGARSLATGLAGFWDAPFFHPSPAVMTLADHLLGPSTLAWLAERVGLGAVAAYNALLLLSFAATGWTAYWVVNRSGASAPASLVAGVAVAFTHFRLDQLAHLEVLLTPWIPLALWGFDRLLERPSPRRAALFAAFYALHVTGGGSFATMLHLPLAALAFNRMADPASRATWSGARPRAVLALAAIACLALSVSLFLPYLRHAEELGIRRAPDEAGRQSAVAWSWLTPSRHSRIAGLQVGPAYRGEAGLFPGILPLLLGGLGLVLLLRRSGLAMPGHAAPTARRTFVAGLAVVALAVGLADFFTLTASDRPFLLAGRSFHGYRGPFLLALLGLAAALWALRRARPGAPGAAAAIACPGRATERLGVWPRGLLLAGAVAALLAHPMVFDALRLGVPGLKTLRVPQRFWAFALPALALLVAVGFDALQSALPRRRSRVALTMGALGLLALELAPVPLTWTRVPEEADLPRILRRLREDPSVNGVLVLPITGDSREAETMLLASSHWKPIANGYGGFQPRSYRRLLGLFSPLPPVEEIPALRGLGISHLQVHRDRISPGLQAATDRWLAAGERSGSLQLLVEENRTLLYAIAGD